MEYPAFFRHLGIDFQPVSHAERLISGLGGFTAILLILVISSRFVTGTDAALIVASMGASAVLLFAAPHGALGQPWNVIGGHLVSAVIGVSCARYIPGVTLAAAASVGLAIGAMHYLRCIHPPGGATALTAVVGGTSIQALGYQYILTPVLLNVAVILTVAVLFNALFRWRRYPASLSGKAPLPALAGKQRRRPIAHADLVAALSQIDSFIDVTEDDLIRIYKLATQRTITGTDDQDGSG